MEQEIDRENRVLSRSFSGGGVVRPLHDQLVVSIRSESSA